MRDDDHRWHTAQGVGSRSAESMAQYTGLAMSERHDPDRFDHIFIQPSSFDASLAYYRDVLGWSVQFAWGGNGAPRGAGLAAAP
jgi:hypothetical protein